MIQWKIPTGFRQRHPLAQLAISIVGILIFVAFGLFALGAAIVVALGLALAHGLRRFRGAVPKPAKARAETPRAPSAATIIDGDFVVVQSTTRNAGS